MPYITQGRREGLREPIDEQVAGMRKVSEPGDERWLQGESLTDLVEGDLHFILTLNASVSLDEFDVMTPLVRVTKELRNRLEDGQQIGGDLNFCLCRYLVGLTAIHHKPKYEDKIQWIQERLVGVTMLIQETNGPYTKADKRSLGILRCVAMELYNRFATPYELQKCYGTHVIPQRHVVDPRTGGNGDIMD